MAFYDDLMTRERPSLRNWVARMVETPFDRRQRQLASQVEALARDPAWWLRHGLCDQRWPIRA